MTTAARILLVEDERIIALEMKLFLQRLGYQVAASLATGEQALADAPAIRPDLVLMDIMLAVYRTRFSGHGFTLSRL